MDPGDLRSVHAHGVLKVRLPSSMFYQLRTEKRSFVQKRVSLSSDRRIIKAPVFTATMLFEAMRRQAVKIFAPPTASTSTKRKTKREPHLLSQVMELMAQRIIPTTTQLDCFTISISPLTGAIT